MDSSEGRERTTYLLVDGENIDATLGSSILGRRPRPEERPRWDRLLQFARDRWSQEPVGLFFLAANTELPMSFVQALISMGYRPVPLTGAASEKVVDIAIQRTMAAIADRDDDVLLVIGFTEFRNHEFTPLIGRGLEVIDLEYDVQAFTARLPRVRIIPIDEFDPLDFL